MSTLLMAVPNEARGARLKEMVTAGNWPWWVIVSGTVATVADVNVSSGTAFAGVELVVRLAEGTVVFARVVRMGASSVSAGVGVYCTDCVVALEPAEAELDEENEVAAEAPTAFADALDCRKIDCSLSGVVWNDGSASRITWY